jgi:hypothetical protein
VSPLTGEVSEVKGKNPYQQYFHIVYQFLVFNDVPTESIPGIPPSIALVSCPKALTDIALANIDGRRSVIKHIDALPTYAASWNVFDVVDVPVLVAFGNNHLVFALGRHD